MINSMNKSRDSSIGESNEDLRRSALIDFLGAGIAPPPSKAVLVSALASARRSIASLQAQGGSIDEWLRREIRYSGVRENAASLAAMEISEAKDKVSRDYIQRHPDRTQELSRILAFL